MNTAIKMACKLILLILNNKIKEFLRDVENGNYPMRAAGNVISPTARSR